VNQEKPFFSADFELTLETGSSRMNMPLSLSEASSRFEFTGASAPKLLAVDPDYHSLRRLDPVEIPPTVNSLKSSDSTACWSAPGLRRRRAAGRDPGPLDGIRNYTIAAENDIAPAASTTATSFSWLPRDRQLLRSAPPGLRLEESGFSLEGTLASADADSFFGVWTHPNNPMRVVAVFLPGPPAAAESAAAKITHYGRFSYLTFNNGQTATRGPGR